MSFDYNLFKKHIYSFDCDSYLTNINPTFNENYHKFYDYYNKIIKEEIENTKQLNAKFSKNMNDKNSKYFKINRSYPNSTPSPIEFKKVCSFESIDDENEKLNIIIRTYLNKISNDTFEKVSDQLIDKLLLNKNINIFKILSEEIINKCIFENKYRNLYINLCSKVWNNKKIHYNIINIVKDSENYYAEYYIDELNTNKIGPYDTIDKLKENVFKKINFKNFFIDFLQDLYYSKDLNFNHLDDDNFFKIKKKTLLLVELISILFIEKHINFDIINLIIIDLLHQNDNFEMIKEIEFELLHVMIKFIWENNKSFKFIEYKKIINKFKEFLESIIKNNTLSITKRSLYFINEIIITFDNIINNVRYEDKNNTKSDINLDKIIGYASNNYNDNFSNEYNNLNSKDQDKVISMLINKILETNNNALIKSLHKIKKNKNAVIESTIKKIIENLDDIILDIPSINLNIETFINELKLSDNLLTILNQKMETIDDNSDDEEFSFRN
tara:strand:- start:36 stop:1532 length:1497 start_codon:yes stop_codon:yes gene_type:complete